MLSSSWLKPHKWTWVQAFNLYIMLPPWELVCFIPMCPWCWCVKVPRTVSGTRRSLRHDVFFTEVFSLRFSFNPHHHLVQNMLFIFYRWAICDPERWGVYSGSHGCFLVVSPSLSFRRARYGALKVIGCPSASIQSEWVWEHARRTVEESLGR